MRLLADLLVEYQRLLACVQQADRPEDAPAIASATQLLDTVRLSLSSETSDKPPGVPELADAEIEARKDWQISEYGQLVDRQDLSMFADWAYTQGANIGFATAQATHALQPATPASHWQTQGQDDPHGNRYACERAALPLGQYSDDELANGAFLNYNAQLNVEAVLSRQRGYYPPIVWMTAVKDRIRWLSRALEAQLAPRPVVAFIQRFTHGRGYVEDRLFLAKDYPDMDSQDWVDSVKIIRLVEDAKRS